MNKSYLQIASILILIAIAVTFVGCRSSYVRSAIIYLGQDDPENAKEVLVEGSELTPEDPELWYYLGKVYFELKEWEEMLGAFDKARQFGSAKIDDIDNSVKEAWRINYNAGLKPFNQVAEGTDLEEPVRKELLSSALAKFLIAHTLLPKDIQTMKAISQSYIKLEDYENAELFLLRAIDADVQGKDIATHTSLLNLYFQQKRWDDVISRSNLILEIDPSKVEVVDRIAIAYQEKDQPEEAVKAWERAIEAYPDNPDYYFNKGIILFSLVDDLDKLKEAAVTFNKVIELNPGDAEAKNWMINSNLRLENWSELRSILEPELFVDGEIKVLDNPENDLNKWRILTAAYANLDLNENAAICAKIIKKLENK